MNRLRAFRQVRGRLARADDQGARELLAHGGGGAAGGDAGRGAAGDVGLHDGGDHIGLYRSI